MNAQFDSTQAAESTVTAHGSSTHLQDILQRAQQYAEENELDFTGSIPPTEAWYLVEQDLAVLVDVRTNEERKFVGYVPESVHVAWATGTSFNRNPRFVKELDSKVGKDKIILLLCRSGKRSALAATAAFSAGFAQVYNVLEGFEGDLNEQQQRNQSNGWRTHQLPWLQD
ncbi:rhodanese-like domain-containing protein [Acinetobacter sp. NIPH 2699]|uniref:rhodanese-like domain-containing protein n=1 Tax=Acinetobacter sp. NIPH 2699 TaxID=2923433 RepID=UPI001F4B2D93|nr:rhodanese-like domain-containing protein [Acinetobacter sp. NIPH 2699]MCH7336096.1 rhodanese-like domain-containing protein [Acinetobacter sp. NIPH 2699]